MGDSQCVNSFVLIPRMLTLNLDLHAINLPEPKSSNIAFSPSRLKSPHTYYAKLLVISNGKEKLVAEKVILFTELGGSADSERTSIK
jgi:hypothetical protein